MIYSLATINARVEASALSVALDGHKAPGDSSVAGGRTLKTSATHAWEAPFKDPRSRQSSLSLEIDRNLVT